MMNFNDTKVGTKLMIGFSAIACAGAIVGGIGIYNMNELDAGLDRMYEYELTALSLVKQAHIDLLDTGRARRDALLASTEAQRSRSLDEADRTVARTRTHLDQARPLFVTETGKATFAELDRTWPHYLSLGKTLDGKIAGARLDDRAEPTRLLLGELASVVRTIEDQMAGLSKTSEQLAKEAALRSHGLYESSRNTMIALALLSLLAGIGLGALFAHKLVRQLGAEPGEAAELAQAVAAGDLARPVPLRPGDTTSMMAQLKAMQESLAKVVSRVRQNSDAVATASAQIAQGNLELSSRTEEQASALEQTAASMEELGSTVKQNADNARQANQLALNASSVAIRGGDVVGQVVGTMKNINDSSRRIADIISVIDGIAFQTNILALNAAVEAARAGEQGRGFAVVASEVRNLAGRSAEAAKEIKSMITASVERVEQGTALVDQAGTTMTEVVNAIKRVTDIMGEISAASTEQSAGVAQIGEAVSQMDQATQQNAALVEESAAAAESLKAQAQQLVQSVAVFKLDGGADHHVDHHAYAAPLAAAPAAAPAKRAAGAPGGIDRRGPNRAKNVTRPAFGQRKAAPAKAAEPAPDASDGRTGTDDGWTSF